MLISRIQKQIIDEHSALLVRPRKEVREKGQPIQYDTKPLFTGNKRGWVILDATTALAMQKCYEALNPAHQVAWDTVSVIKLVDFVWRHAQ